MVQTPTQSLSFESPSLDAFLKLPETKPASEYLDGKITQKLMPQGQHSMLQDKLGKAINTAVEPNKIARFFPQLRCTFGGSSIVPDIAVFEWVRIPKNDNGRIANVFLLAPDWTIEILSPGQRPTKVTKNILRCLKHGAQMGWLIDPEDESVFVHRREQEIKIFNLDEPAAALPMPAFMSALTLTVEDLFAFLVL